MEMRKSGFDRYMTLQIQLIKLYRIMQCVKSLRLVSKNEAGIIWHEKGYADNFSKIFRKKFGLN